MMRRLHLTFACHGATLGATLDTAPSNTGLLIVSGGNEIRAGAFNGQARLAVDIASMGFPVFRFDRRGVGDSIGENTGFLNERDDIAAAIGAFRATVPHLTRIIAFGNCDAASALMLARGAGCDGLVLSNPWTIEDEEVDAQPASAIRARYIAKLKNPREVLRLVTGGVNLRKLGRGMMQASQPKTAASSLGTKMAERLSAFSGPVSILLAENDRTAQIFAERWDANDPRIHWCAGAGHSYVEPETREWLLGRVLAALRAPVSE